MRTTSTGFTLLELMVVVAIAAILLSIAVPSMRQFFQNSRMTTAANDLLAAVHLARTEAVKRQAPAVVCFTTTPDDAAPACDGTPASGWIVFADADPAVPTAGGNGNGVLDANEPILVRHPALDPTIRARTQPSGSVTYIPFNTAGFVRPLAPGTPVQGVVLCDERGNSNEYGPEHSTARGLLIPASGRPRITRSVALIGSDANLGGCP